MFANLAHWHILQVGRAALRKLKWPLNIDPALGIHHSDSEGRLSISALAAHRNGEEFKQWVEEGQVRCKVLSQKIDVEEPSAAACISCARNKGHTRSMAEHEWTAISTLNGLVIPSNGELAEEVLYNRFLQRVCDVMGVDAVKTPLFRT